MFRHTRWTSALVGLLLMAACTPPAPSGSSGPTTGAAQAAASPSSDTIVIKVGHVIADTEPTQQAALQWAQRVKERTNGRVELEIFPNSQLGSDKETAEQARLGANVIAYTSPAYLGESVPDFEVVAGPFLFKDATQVDKIVNAPLFASWEKRLLDERGLRVLAFNWYFGDRHLITTKRDVRMPEDLKGQKIRALPAPMWIETLTAMGASPTPMNFSEVYSAMQQGVIDGAEAPLSTLYGSKLYEVGKHISLTAHFTQVNGWIIGEQYFQSLPQAVQKVLEEEAISAGKYETDLTLKSDAEWKQKLEAEGVTFTTPDRAAFERATAGVYTKLGQKWTPGVYDQIKQIRDS